MDESYSGYVGFASFVNGNSFFFLKSSVMKKLFGFFSNVKKLAIFQKIVNGFFMFSSSFHNPLQSCSSSSGYHQLKFCVDLFIFFCFFFNSMGILVFSEKIQSTQKRE